MNPGIYTDITNEQYHSSEGISRSGIMAFRRTPLHYWHRYLNPERSVEAPTLAMEFGSALHTLILEPKKFIDDYIIEEKFNEEINKPLLLKDVGREAFEKDKINQFNHKKMKDKFNNSFKLRSIGKKIISEQDVKKINDMAESFHRNEDADCLIKNSDYENSIYWIDKESGVLCKARADIMCDRYIADIKTTKDASEYDFKNSIRKYGYDIQAAMLLDGMNTVKGTNCETFINLPIEKEEPYANSVILLSHETIEEGRRKYKESLMIYAECLRKNEWPSYPTITIWGLNERLCDF